MHLTVIWIGLVDGGTPLSRKDLYFSHSIFFFRVWPIIWWYLRCKKSRNCRKTEQCVLPSHQAKNLDRFYPGWQFFANIYVRMLDIYTTLIYLTQIYDRWYIYISLCCVTSFENVKECGFLYFELWCYWYII